MDNDRLLDHLLPKRLEGLLLELDSMPTIPAFLGLLLLHINLGSFL